MEAVFCPCSIHYMRNVLHRRASVRGHYSAPSARWQEAAAE